MAWAFVQDDGTFASDGGSTTISQAFGSSVTAGNSLVAWVGWLHATSTCSVSDNVNGAWTPVAASLARNGSNSSQFFYLPSAASGSTTVTATLSSSSTYRLFHVYEFSGLKTSDMLHAANDATGTGTDPTVVVDTTGTPTLIMGGIYTDGTSSAFSGYTAGPVTDGNASEYKNQATSGAVTVQIGNTNSFYAFSAVAWNADDTTAPPVSFITNSTVPSATTATSTTTTLNLTYPSVTAEDLIVVGVGVKPDTATVSTPSGFTAPANGDLAGGGGTTGADTGPTRMATFYKEATGSESGTLAITLANSPNVSWGIILIFRRGDLAATWDIAAVSAADTTTGTPFTATMGSNPGLAATDMVAIFGCIPTDVTTPAQFSSPTLTATGITSTVTEVGEPDSTSGNDIGGLVCYASIDTGPASAAPTFSATAGGTTTNVRGPIVLMRLRSVAAPGSLLFAIRMQHLLRR